MKHGIVQHGDARCFERAPVNLAMELVVSDVIEADIGVSGIQFDIAQRRKRAEQCGGIIGYAGARRRHGGEEAEFHSFFLGPTTSAPPPPIVAPSSLAPPRSCVIPPS